MNRLRRYLFSRYMKPVPARLTKAVVFKPKFDSLEDRVVPDGRPLPLPVIYVGAETGAPPIVKTYDAETGLLKFERTVYESTFTGGVRVGAADMNADGYPDLIIGPGPGGAPRVRILDGHTGETINGPLGDFLAFDASFKGGVEVDAGDVNGDDVPDLIVAAGKDGGPHVRIFNGKSGQQLFNVMAFDEDFRGGVSIAAADFTGDGKSELIVGAGPGGGPHVKIYDVSTGLPIASALGNFFAFDSEYRGGIHVGSDWKTGDVTGDAWADLAVATGPDRDPIVKLFNGKSGLLDRTLSVFDTNMRSGVRVGMAFVTDDIYADIVVSTGVGAVNQIRVYDGMSNQQLSEGLGQYQPFGSTNTGGVTLATTNDPPVQAPADEPSIEDVPGIFEIAMTGPAFGFSSMTPWGNYDADVRIAAGYDMRENGSTALSGQHDYDALRNALTGYVNVTINGQFISYPVTPETVGSSWSDFKPFMLTPGVVTGDFTLAFEDSALLNDPNTESDWDYNDLTWTFSSIAVSKSNIVSMPTVNPSFMPTSTGSPTSGSVITVDDSTSPLEGIQPKVPVDPPPSAPLPPIPISPPWYTGTINGRVWSDLSTTNGTENSSETGIDSQLVELYDTNGNRHAYTYTRNGGFYTFGFIPLGDYKVRVALPPQSKFSDFHANTDTTIDSDIEALVSPYYDRTMTISVTANHLNYSHIDAGIISPPIPPSTPPTLPPSAPTGSIQGRVWADSATTNGTEDSSELGIRDHFVELINSKGIRITSAYTDVYGKYLFNFIPLGEYRVQVALPNQAKFSDPHANSNKTIDSDIIDMFTFFGRSLPIYVTAIAPYHQDIDAGILLPPPPPPPPPSGTITGRVWSDQLTSNGTQNSGEFGIRMNSVQLIDANGKLSKSTYTDNSGNYSFRGIAFGDYTVQVGLPTNAVFSQYHANSDKTLDSDIVDSASPIGWTSTISITATGLIHSNIDAGIILPPPPPPPPTGVVSGMVWNDGMSLFGNPIISDGVRIQGEQGVGGILVQLIPNFLGKPAPGTYFQSTYTDANGRYTFNNVPNSKYQVEFTVPNTAWFGPFRVGGDPTVDSDVHQVQQSGGNHLGRTPSFLVSTAPSGQYTNVYTNVDAGIDFSSSNYGVVSGKVWDDRLTPNGLSIDADDHPLAGISVGLNRTTGNYPTLWTSTDIDGKYTFGNLAYGSYQVAFNNPLSYLFTLANQKTTNPYDNDDEFDSDVITANGVNVGWTDNVTLTLQNPIKSNVDVGITTKPVVTISSSESTIFEPAASGAHTSVLHISRENNSIYWIQNSSLLVDLSFSGNAIRSVDYVLKLTNGIIFSGTTVSLAPGVQYIDLLLCSLDDSIAEENEIVVAMINESNDYLCTDNITGVAILDDPVKIDIDIDSDRDEKITTSDSSIDEINEESLGTILVANKDGVYDLAVNPLTGGIGSTGIEHRLNLDRARRRELRITSSNLPANTKIILKRTSSNISIFTKKSNDIAGDAEIAFDVNGEAKVDNNTTLWLQGGINTSTEIRDVKIKAREDRQGSVFKDTIAATIIWSDIEVRNSGKIGQGSALYYDGYTLKKMWSELSGEPFEDNLGIVLYDYLPANRPEGAGKNQMRGAYEVIGSIMPTDFRARAFDPKTPITRWLFHDSQNLPGRAGQGHVFFGFLFRRYASGTLYLDGKPGSVETVDLRKDDSFRDWQDVDPDYHIDGRLLIADNDSPNAGPQKITVFDPVSFKFVTYYPNTEHRRVNFDEWVTFSFLLDKQERCSPRAKISVIADVGLGYDDKIVFLESAPNDSVGTNEVYKSKHVNLGLFLSKPIVDSAFRLDNDISKRIFRGENMDNTIVIKGQNLIGEVYLQKGTEAPIKATTIRYKVSSETTRLSDAFEIRANFKTNLPQSQGYSLYITNVGGTSIKMDGFEIL